MSTIDPLAALLADLDRPVEPRPAFSEALLSQLLGELRPARGGAGRGGASSWRALLQAGTSTRLRLVLVLLALLLLLAGIATATYVGVRTWVSAGPNGPQATSDYRLSVVFDAPPGETRVEYFGYVLGPDGHDLYAVRRRIDRPRTTEVVRVRMGDSTVPGRPETMLDFRDLADPRLWDPGTSPGAGFIRTVDYAALAADAMGNVYVKAGRAGRL